ncbi:MAG: 4Fe-4S cluster-binding domain-containing protein [Sulfurospirillum sp.]|nr:4Fe-4S cluster-binding domain-containing protein [Sulfurospirillum sp.]
MNKIVDIFYSLQGEGTFVGTPSIFIRFYGCNLECSFCDDIKHTESFEHFSNEELLQKIQGFTCKQVVITGGEPSIYNLNAFIEFLQAYGYFVCVESNGFKFANIQSANWITYSPKDWDTIALKGCDEYKFIVSSASKVDKILALQTNKPIFIQPQNDFLTANATNVKYCIELVKAHSRLRLSVQLHKYLGVE